MPVILQQNGLMVACCKGFINIVYGLHGCPFVDINHQDNEGNTALMIASQAGKSLRGPTARRPWKHIRSNCGTV